MYLNKAWEETKIPETFKIALIMGMLPKEYQDSVFYKIGIDPAKTVKDVPDYEAVKEMVVRLFNHKQEMSRPAPMDIGGMEEGEEDEGF